MASWIEIEVALPIIQGTTSEYVLLYDKNRGYLVGFLCKNEGDPFFEIKDSNSRHKSRLNITHWQELPITPLDEKFEEMIKDNWIIRTLKRLRIIRKKGKKNV